MNKLLGTGLQGLVGSQLVQALHSHYSFTNLSRSTGVDITNPAQVMSAVKASDAPYLIHLAAKADVDGCEQDKSQGENGEAWQINVQGTKNVAEACQAAGKTLIYISTDFVFDGTKGDYTEEDQPSPVNWYGMTKFEGEQVLQKSGVSYIIVRPAYPFGRPFEKKKDFVQAIVGRLREGKEIAAVTDHIFTPTYIPDFALAIDAIIRAKERNTIFHVVGSQSLSPYEAAMAIAKQFNFAPSLVKSTTRAEFFKGRAERPYKLSMKNGKIEKLGTTMNSFEQGIHLL